MSIQLIQRYYDEINKLRKFGGSSNESVLRGAFLKLLNGYAQQHDLMIVPELDYRTTTGKTVRPDGTLKDCLRLDWGYWESKDTDDDLDTEITKKFKKGYPNSNMIFEDGQTAVLFQGGNKVQECAMSEADKLDSLLHSFVGYTRSEVKDFREAVEKFKEDLPQVIEGLRSMIEKQGDSNKTFVAVREAFLEMCQTAINGQVTVADVNEMLMQHILTEEIFTTVFDDPQFHQENNISRELQKLEKTFFTGQTKRQTLDGIKPYYQMIKARAGEIANHAEKQKFLKVIYENFYKAYNPLAADKLGIIYTPNEIVKFMIEGTDWLLHKHFNKGLAGKDVEILDPATGTGTFICDIIEHLPESKLEYKYKNEMHCNEVAILPYYIANLNIEATYKQKMGRYEEFGNICFVDTLDNTGGITHATPQGSFAFVSAENADRVRKQNKKKISVIIGNPPYSAKQANYNYQNANRFYKFIDDRIRNTYVKHGKAQNQIVLFDMYVRFVRWASDRVAENGIVALITNRSYVDALTFDGFRKCIVNEFSDIYILDTHSDVRENPKISGSKYNVFGIQTGVAVMFLVKKTGEKQEASIHYAELPDEQTRVDKLEFLARTHLRDIDFQRITPDKKGNWLDLTDNDFDELLPLIDKMVKAKKDGEAVFKLFSRGVATQRDEWVYDVAERALAEKVKYMVRVYEQTVDNAASPEKFNIKWDRELSKYLGNGIRKKFDMKQIRTALYRPYFTPRFYFDRHFNGMTYQWFDMMGGNNRYIVIPGLASPKPFHVVASPYIIDLNCLPAGCQCLPIYYFDQDGNPVDNITDWALKQFWEHYRNKRITKEDIFRYVYGVLHDPVYRKKYALNLKRDFPRIPFYEDFGRWRDWGRGLMELHIGFETARPYGLKRIDAAVTPKAGKSKKDKSGQLPQFTTLESEEIKAPKPKLKADKAAGIIEIDEVTQLEGVPAEAWEYRLGNRSAIEWILEEYKERKPKDPTIAEKFNTYRFADHKEKVIDLIGRVCTVSVETMKIIREMEAERKQD
jgi:predicted helicase